MKRVYTIGKSHFILALCSVLFILFFLTQPRVASYFPWHYTQFQLDFLDKVIKDKIVDPKTYWQFREFYSPGNFSFDSNIVTFGETQMIRALPNDKNILLIFTAPRLTSVDYIIKIPTYPAQAITMNYLVSQYDPSHAQDQVMFTDDTTRLWKTSDGRYALVFVKTIDEMKTANGFFDYTGPEKNYWKILFGSMSPLFGNTPKNI